jgi:5-methylcytosine-specific restriction endonuclease McrA
MGQATHDLLRHVEDLLGRRLASEDMERAFAAGLEAMATKLEQRKLAATERPREQTGPARGRHIPAEMKRRVWKRDQGRCTFVSESGRRCDARRFLEFDHIEPVARGGKTTAENLRLRCRAHNQLEAERAFGAGFMHAVREGQRAGAGARSGSAAGP